MPVRIRLARAGHKNYPFYRIMAAERRRPRDGKFLEVLGSYCPLVDKMGCKHLKVNTDRFKYWMAVGAEPSETVRFISFHFQRLLIVSYGVMWCESQVARLLSRFGLLPPPPPPVNMLAKAKEIETANVRGVPGAVGWPGVGGVVCGRLMC